MKPSVTVIILLCFAATVTLTLSDSDLILPAGEINATDTELNATRARSMEDSFANMIDRALEKEFPENEQNDVTDPGSFNNSVADQQAVLETVARVRPKKNESLEKEKSFFDNDNQAEDTPMLIDRKDNVFIMSNAKSKYPVLQLDLRLISDLVVVIVSGNPLAVFILNL